MTEPVSIPALADEHLELAHAASSGRSAHTLHGGRQRQLRHTLIALVGGRALGEHSAPGEATIHVLRGRVRLRAGEELSWELGFGDHMDIPAERHDLEALEDAVVLLTVVVGKH